MNVTTRRLPKKSPATAARWAADLVNQQGALAAALPPEQGRHATRVAHLLVERLPDHDVNVTQVGELKYLTVAPKGAPLTWAELPG